MENRNQRKQENKNDPLLHHKENPQQAKGNSMEVEDKVAVTVSRNAWLTLAILSSTLLTVFFSETMLLPAIPEIIQDFNITYGTAAWIFSAYLIVAAVMTPVAGRLSDLYGKKKILLILLTIYIAGLTAGGFADNISFLLAARIIQNFGWHATFLAIVPFSALVTFMIAKFVKENNKEQQNQFITAKALKTTASNNKKRASSHLIDIKGVLALSATITSFLIALTLIQTGVSSENLLQIAAAFIASAISLSIFVILERRTIQPFLDLRLLKHKILLQIGRA